jgi:hypothetical protein
MQYKTKKIKESQSLEKSIATSKYLLRKETLTLHGGKDFLNLGFHVVQDNPHFAEES